MEIKTDSEAKFYRELLARKYAQSSIETYISCLRVIEQKVSNNFDVDKIKESIEYFKHYIIC